MIFAIDNNIRLGPAWSDYYFHILIKFHRYAAEQEKTGSDTKKSSTPADSVPACAGGLTTSVEDAKDPTSSTDENENNKENEATNGNVIGDSDVDQDDNDDDDDDSEADTGSQSTSHPANVFLDEEIVLSDDDDELKLS